MTIGDLEGFTLEDQLALLEEYDEDELKQIEVRLLPVLFKCHKLDDAKNLSINRIIYERMCDLLNTGESISDMAHYIEEEIIAVTLMDAYNDVYPEVLSKIRHAIQSFIALKPLHDYEVIVGWNTGLCAFIRRL